MRQVVAKKRSRSKNYRVGKGRPPLETRWKPGQSGNLRGRPKGHKNVATYAREVLNRKVKAQVIDDKVRSITVREAIVIKHADKALKGDLKAAAELFAYEVGASEKSETLPPVQDADDPNAAIEAYFQIVKGGKD